MASEHEHGDLQTPDEPDTQPPRAAATTPADHYPGAPGHTPAAGEIDSHLSDTGDHATVDHHRGTNNHDHPHDATQPHDAAHSHDGHDHPHDATHPHDTTQPHDGHDHPHDTTQPHDAAHSHDGHDHPHEDSDDRVDGHGGHDHPYASGRHEHPHGDGHSHETDDELRRDGTPGHSHGDGHDHSHGDAHDHEHGSGWWARLTHLVAPHSHDTADKVDTALEGSREGMRALWLSLAGLGVTAALQAVVVVWSGSVALLGDTLHNVADALTALPLALAFLVGRRPANRRYTYGYGRAEDLAGIFIVVVIAASSVIAGWQAVDRLLHPSKVDHLVAVAVAAVVGFVGNEAVARLRIRVGKRIGSAALVADGVHARTDGFTSLAVLVGAGGVAIGWPWADPMIGLVITVAILFVLKDAAREIYRRLMDAVDPALVAASEAALRSTKGVRDIGELRLRWVGHQLRAECAIVVDSGLSLIDAHAISVEAEHRLLHDVPKLQAALVHADPAPDGSNDHHEHLSHHRP